MAVLFCLEGDHLLQTLNSFYQISDPVLTSLNRSDTQTLKKTTTTNGVREDYGLEASQLRCHIKQHSAGYDRERMVHGLG